MVPSRGFAYFAGIYRFPPLLEYQIRIRLGHNAASRGLLVAAVRLARGMCGVFARLPAVEWLASVLLVGESEALELVLSGFEGDRWLVRARSG